MLTQNEILKRIDSGRTNIIKKFVRVIYDSKIQLPIDFWFQGKHHEILEVIHSKKLGNFSSEFLLRTDKGIYNFTFYYLYLNIKKFQLPIYYFWKMEFQVLES